MAAYAIVWVVVRHGAADGDVTKSPWLAGMFVVAILVAWCVYSAWTLWREEEPLAVASSTALERSAHPSSPYSRVRVGLALSGGGYRAALMHAGVLAALEEHSVPVTHLSTVSGGSIIGAFYAIGGPPEAFRAAVGTGRMNLPGRLANLFNAVRLPFPIRVPWADVQLFPWFSFDRIDVQADQLDRVLLSRRKLADLAVDRGGQPRHPLLQICATDLNSGAAVGIASDGVLITRLPHYTALRGAESPAPGVPWAKHAVALREEPLARIVAASGAFPGAFNAVRMYVKEATGNQLALALSDGGVTDNLGVGLLLERHFDALHTATGAWQVDLVIVSDGSQPLGEARRSGAVAVIDELARAIDIVYAGSGWRPVIGDTRPLPRMAFLRPADVGAHPDVETFQKTSTLSDQIPRDSANSLYRLGTLLVERAWSDKLEPALRQLQSQREARPPTR
jgi:predicted acylesterase/phospholipase RssA